MGLYSSYIWGSLDQNTLACAAMLFLFSTAWRKGNTCSCLCRASAFNIKPENAAAVAHMERRNARRYGEGPDVDSGSLFVSEHFLSAPESEPVEQYALQWNYFTQKAGGRKAHSKWELQCVSYYSGIRCWLSDLMTRVSPSVDKEKRPDVINVLLSSP